MQYCEVQLDLGEIGCFTANVKYSTALMADGNAPFESYYGVDEIKAVEVNLGVYTVNVVDFLSSEKIDELKLWILNNIINPEE